MLFGMPAREGHLLLQASARQRANLCSGTAMPAMLTCFQAQQGPPRRASRQVHRLSSRERCRTCELLCLRQSLLLWHHAPALWAEHPQQLCGQRAQHKEAQQTLRIWLTLPAGHVLCLVAAPPCMLTQAGHGCGGGVALRQLLKVSLQRRLPVAQRRFSCALHRVGRMCVPSHFTARCWAACPACIGCPCTLVIEHSPQPGSASQSQSAGCRGLAAHPDQPPQRLHSACRRQPEPPSDAPRRRRRGLRVSSDRQGLRHRAGTMGCVPSSRISMLQHCMANSSTGQLPRGPTHTGRAAPRLRQLRCA